MEDGVGVQVLFRDNLLDDFVHEILGDLLVRHALDVLGGDQDGVHALRHHGAAFVFVLDGDLRLTIREHPRARTILADDGEAVTELGGQNVRQRHEFRSFIRGVAKHVTLVTRTDVFIGLGAHTVHTLTNVRGLVVQLDEHAALVTVQAGFIRDETDVAAHLAHDGFVVNLGLGRDFTENHHHVGLRRGLARNLGIRILREARIQDAVGDLIRELIRVTLVHGFGSEKKSHIYVCGVC